MATPTPVDNGRCRDTLSGMTPADLQTTIPNSLTIEEALRRAFDAGAAWQVHACRSFTPTHADRDTVVPVLLRATGHDTDDGK